MTCISPETGVLLAHVAALGVCLSPLPGIAAARTGLGVVLHMKPGSVSFAAPFPAYQNPLGSRAHPPSVAVQGK